MLALDGLKTVLALPRRRRPPGARSIDELEPLRACPRRHLAAAVGRLRALLRRRGRGPARRGPPPGGRGARDQPAQRVPRVRRVPARPRRLVRPARRRPRRRPAGSAAQAVEASSPVDHPWWYATAGRPAGRHPDRDRRPRRGRGRRPARAGRHASEEREAGGRLRCLAALAVVTGDPDVVAEATRALDAVDCPPGRAWVTGADVYLCSARPSRCEQPTEHALARDPVSDHARAPAEPRGPRRRSAPAR